METMMVGVVEAAMETGVGKAGGLTPSPTPSMMMILTTAVSRILLPPGVGAGTPRHTTTIMVQVTS